MNSFMLLGARTGAFFVKLSFESVFFAWPQFFGKSWAAMLDRPQFSCSTTVGTEGIRRADFDAC
ncbi:hypothetical protein D3C86_2037140 [compost metagenome]